MSTPDMTLGELGRIVATLTTEVRQGRVETAEAIKAMRTEQVEHNRRYETEFLRREQYEALQAADAIHLNGLESELHHLKARVEAAEQERKDEKKDSAGRNRMVYGLIVSAFLGPLLILIVNVVALRSMTP